MFTTSTLGKKEEFNLKAVFAEEEMIFGLLH